jgi:hypothetical protein
MLIPSRPASERRGLLGGTTGGAESADGAGTLCKAGDMAVIGGGGQVRPGMPVDVILPVS